MMNPVAEAEIVLIEDDLFSEKAVSVSVLRLDAIHPHINGNKWCKLRYNLEEFAHQQKKFLVTFGGAFSNHIIAVAAAGLEYGIQTVGIIRGDELHESSNPALQFASQCGMKLFFMPRDEYKKNAGIPENNFPFGLEKIFVSAENGISAENCYVLPEGGANDLGVKGCAEMIREAAEDFDVISCACGTGTTLAGISSALNRFQEALGIAVVNRETLTDDHVLSMNGNRKNFSLRYDYTFRGYARSAPELDLFCSRFSDQHQFKIEPVYTGKMFFGLYDLIKTDFFKKGSRILAVHSGGIHEFNR